jgi:futalosine hydrolase
MFLVVCATEFELQSLLDLEAPAQEEWTSLVTGVGMVETTLSLTRFLEGQGPSKERKIQAVLNFGVGGAYIYDGQEKADLLEVCLAEQEIFGDLGVCYPDRMEPLADHLVHRTHYNLDSDVVDRAEFLLKENDLAVRRGNFVTVCGVSATACRGAMLGRQYDALCENMEGAAVARVCEEFDLPLLEMRTISNFVEERDVARWKLREACDQAGKAAAILLKGLKKI